MQKRNPERRITRTRLKKVYFHKGKKLSEYKPKFPKPGKSIKIDDPNSPTWKRKARALWYRYIHKKFPTCLVDLDCEGEIEAHHFIGIGNVLFAFHPENGAGLCRRHHRESKECSPHAGPEGFSEFLLENFPDVSAFIIENQHATGKADFRADCHRLEKLLEGF